MTSKIRPSRMTGGTCAFGARREPHIRYAQFIRAMKQERLMRIFLPIPEPSGSASRVPPPRPPAPPTTGEIPFGKGLPAESDFLPLRPLVLVTLLLLSAAAFFS